MKTANVKKKENIILKNESLDEEEMEDLKEEILNEEELGTLIRIDSKINCFMMNEEQIQNIIDRLEKLEIIGKKCFKILGKR